MLQNESQTETPAQAGRVRITPEELSRAVAAIESRRQAEAQRLAGTIPIEEAVSSLHLDATHEEVWTEVQAQRAAAERGQAEAARQQASRAPFSVPQAVPVRGRRWSWRQILAAGVIFSTLWGTRTIQHVGFPSVPSIFTSSHSTLVVNANLAQIPDGKEVYCDTATLVQISEGKPERNIRVAETPGDNSWSLTKMDGHVYLHAFSLPVTSLAAQAGKPIVLDNDDNSGTLEGERTSKTTLRIDHVRLQVSGGSDDYSEITVPNFQPDQLTTTGDWR